MELEIFTLCDFAQDNNGKLLVVGTFDTINMQQLPAQINSCFIAARIRFTDGEKGKIPLGLYIKSAEGEDVIPPLDGELQIPYVQGIESIAQNLCIGIGGIQIKKYGKYTISISLNGKEMKTLPLYITKPQQRAN